MPCMLRLQITHNRACCARCAHLHKVCYSCRACCDRRSRTTVQAALAVRTFIRYAMHAVHAAPADHAQPCMQRSLCIPSLGVLRMPCMLRLQITHNSACCTRSSYLHKVCCACRACFDCRSRTTVHAALAVQTFTRYAMHAEQTAAAEHAHNPACSARSAYLHKVCDACRAYCDCRSRTTVHTAQRYAMHAVSAAPADHAQPCMLRSLCIPSQSMQCMPCMLRLQITHNRACCARCASIHKKCNASRACCDCRSRTVVHAALAVHTFTRYAKHAVRAATADHAQPRMLRSLCILSQGMLCMPRILRLPNTHKTLRAALAMHTVTRCAIQAVYAGRSLRTLSKAVADGHCRKSKRTDIAEGRSRRTLPKGRSRRTLPKAVAHGPCRRP